MKESKLLNSPEAVTWAWSYKQNVPHKITKFNSSVKNKKKKKLSTTRVRYFFVGMPYNWSFYHPGPIEGEESGILLFR